MTALTALTAALGNGTGSGFRFAGHWVLGDADDAVTIFGQSTGFAANGGLSRLFDGDRLAPAAARTLVAPLRDRFAAAFGDELAEATLTGAWPARAVTLTTRAAAAAMFPDPDDPGRPLVISLGTRISRGGGVAFRTRVDRLLRRRARLLTRLTAALDAAAVDRVRDLGGICPADAERLAAILTMRVATALISPVAAGCAWLLVDALAEPDLVRADPRGVVRESLRLHPPAWLIERQVVEPVRLTVGEVAPGELVYVSPYLIHRRPDYHEDPDRFRPQRWSGRRVPPGRYLPFGLGQHACVGADIAYAALELFQARLTAARLRPRRPGADPTPIRPCPVLLPRTFTVTELR